MTITGLVFPAFVFFSLFLYYVLPKRGQWIVLLLAGLCFYILTSAWGIFFVLFTAATVYGAALWIDALRKKQKRFLKEGRDRLSAEEKKKFKTANRKKRKGVLTAAILLNVGLLCFFKYSHFFVEQINRGLVFFGKDGLNNDFTLISVLGISFYTFQSIGYLVDVYWETAEAQRNFAKMLLFVSFFPQVTQGPISDYGQLSGELFGEHAFSAEGFSRGFQRMLWGYFKKIVIADYLAPFVQDAFENYPSYIGLACLLAAFGYSVQIYADFSGYMDIMCGICEMFGIRLAENFERPYFSKSVAEYWRRWHITLGAWFKKYIYYPIGVSQWNRALAKKSGRLGKTVSENLPATVALLIVWFVTGLWHGASWAYIAWGGVNGLFIIFSMWMEPVYARANALLHVKEQKFLRRAFQTGRTFLLITLIKVLPEVGSLSDGLGFWKRIFTDLTLTTNLKLLIPYLKRAERPWFFFICFCIALLFFVSLLQRKKPVRSYLARIPSPLRAAALALFAFFILLFSFKTTDYDAGFMYAGF